MKHNINFDSNTSSYFNDALSFEKIKPRCLQFKKDFIDIYHTSYLETVRHDIEHILKYADQVKVISKNGHHFKDCERVKDSTQDYVDTCHCISLTSTCINVMALMEFYYIVRFGKKD